MTLTRSQPATPTRAQGFTLIELLVVIAVIALLIGILLPSLGAAKEAGKQTQCAAHLRQVGVAVSAYAVSAKGYYSSGRFDNRQNSGSGPIDEVGWLADMMLGEYCNPGKMLCPTNPARLSQALTSGRLTDRPSKAFNIPDDQAELVRRGFNTNYTMSWYMAYTEFRNNRNSSNDPQRLVYTLGPLRDSRIMGTAPNFVPLFADGRVEDDASAGPTTEIVDGVVYRFTKDLTVSTVVSESSALEHRGGDPLRQQPGCNRRTDDLRGIHVSTARQFRAALGIERRCRSESNAVGIVDGLHVGVC